jgi:hypothetical protein
MHSPFHTFKAAMATLISLWMAVLACFMGCALPALTNAHAEHGSAIPRNVADTLAEQGDSEPMPDMECCHHSGGTSPAKRSDGKPVPTGRMSCCPLEITVTAKWDTPALSIAPAPDFVVASSFDLVKIPSYDSVELVPSLWHSGRDTLLKTRLLRI